MENNRYPQVSNEMTEMPSRLAPEIEFAFRKIIQAAFKEGAMSRNTKHSIAVAEADVTPMRSGGACAHAVNAVQTLQDAAANTASATVLQRD